MVGPVLGPVRERLLAQPALEWWPGADPLLIALSGEDGRRRLPLFQFEAGRLLQLRHHLGGQGEFGRTQVYGVAVGHDPGEGDLRGGHAEFVRRHLYGPCHGVLPLPDGARVQPRGLVPPTPPGRVYLPDRIPPCSGLHATTDIPNASAIGSSSRSMSRFSVLWQGTLCL